MSTKITSESHGRPALSVLEQLAGHQSALPPEIIAQQRKAGLARRAQMTHEDYQALGRKAWAARVAKYQVQPEEKPARPAKLRQTVHA